MITDQSSENGRNSNVWFTGPLKFASSLDKQLASLSPMEAVSLVLGAKGSSEMEKTRTGSTKAQDETRKKEREVAIVKEKEMTEPKG